MQTETLQALDDISGTIYPIQLVQIGTLHDIAAPLARISTCGGLSIEVLEEVISLDPPQGRYVLLTLKQLRKQHKGYRTGWDCSRYSAANQDTLEPKTGSSRVS